MPDTAGSGSGSPSGPAEPADHAEPDFSANFFDQSIKDAFVDAVESFRSTLEKAQQEKFDNTQLIDVKKAILLIQRDQERQRAMMSFCRIQFFLERFEEFDNVCQSLQVAGDQTGRVSAYLWGPARHILSVAKEDPGVLDPILSAYQKFGKEVPNLRSYPAHLKKELAVAKCILFMYQDLVAFHKTLVKFLAERGWRKTFSANWKDYTSSFDTILQSFDAHSKALEEFQKAWSRQLNQDSNKRMNDHILQYQDDRAEYQQDRDLILRGAQASVDSSRRLNDYIIRYGDDQMELRECLEKIEQARIEFLDKAREQEGLRRQEQRDRITKWLAPLSDVQADFHGKCKKIRAKYPDTGSWVLNQRQLVSWINDAETTSSSSLWINGKKGAGKSVLASMIIEQCKKMSHFSTSYYYCREDDPSRNTALSVLKTILLQMVMQNEDLLPSCIERSLKSKEVLDDLPTAESLIGISCELAINQFIIVDGLDECAPVERKLVIKFLNSMIQKCDAYKPGKVRFLLISQDLADIRQRMQEADSEIFNLGPAQMQEDIRRYIARRAMKLQTKFDLSPDELASLQSTVCLRAEGVFLFAVLTMKNLSKQPNTGVVKKEVKEGSLPKDLGDAYKKIIDRLQRDLVPNQWIEAKKIFGWLAGAKRPLKFHELQAALSIQVDDGETPIDYHNRKLRDDIRTICGSLVQVLGGGHLQFIHSTTKEFVVKHEGLDMAAIECDLTVLCLRYLCLDAFRQEAGDAARAEFARDGYYSFHDYAVSKWSLHVESLIQRCRPLLLDPVRGSTHQKQLCLALSLFMGFYKDITPDSSPENTHLAVQVAPAILNIEDSPELARQSLDVQGVDAMSVQSVQSQTESDPLAFCEAFQHSPVHADMVIVWTHIWRHQKSNHKERNEVSLKGLATTTEKIRATLEELAVQSKRDKILAEKIRNYYGTRLYKCRRVTCDYFYEGFESRAALDNHSNRHDRPFHCPIDKCSFQRFGFSTNKDVDKHVRSYHPDATDRLAPFADLSEKRIATAEARFACDICKQSFTRSLNRDRHVDSHYGRRNYTCPTCGKAFTRANDRNRHQKTHVRRG